MDNRDYRNDPLFREKRRDNAAIWLGVVAVAVISAFVFYGVTQKTTDPGVMGVDPEQQAMSSSGTAMDDGVMTQSPEGIEPAEGDSFTNQTPAADMPAPAPTSGDMPAEAPAASVAPAALPPSYATEEDCKAATSVPCHYVTCDSVPEGKQPDEACGPDFKKGWQPLAAAPDKTTVPEAVNPPLTGQGTDPVPANPPLTGQ